MSLLQNLLIDTLPQLVEFLSIQDVARLGRCSRLFTKLVNQDSVWIQFLIRAGIASFWDSKFCKAKDFYYQCGLFPRIGELIRLRVSLGQTYRVVLKVGPFLLLDSKISEMENGKDALAITTAVVDEKDEGIDYTQLIWAHHYDCHAVDCKEETFTSENKSIFTFRETVQRQISHFKKIHDFAVTKCLGENSTGESIWPPCSGIRISPSQPNATIQEPDGSLKIVLFPYLTTKQKLNQEILEREAEEWRRFQAVPPIVQCTLYLLDPSIIPSPNSRLLVLDTVNHWYGATILSVDAPNSKIYIRYEGWSSKWDEWISWTNECFRLAPIPKDFTTISFGRAREITENWTNFPCCKFVTWKQALLSRSFSWNQFNSDPLVPINYSVGQILEALSPPHGWFAAIIKEIVAENVFTIAFDGLDMTSTLILPKDALLIRQFDATRATHGPVEPVLKWSDYTPVKFVLQSSIQK